MKKFLASGIVGAAMVVGTYGAVFADDHSAPGIPGTPNCHGQTIAFLAQSAKNGFGDAAFHGIGGVGRLLDASTKDVQTLVDEFCAG